MHQTYHTYCRIYIKKYPKMLPKASQKTPKMLPNGTPGPLRSTSPRKHPKVMIWVSFWSPFGSPIGSLWAHFWQIVCYFGYLFICFFRGPPGQHICRKWVIKACRKQCLDCTGVSGSHMGRFLKKSSPICIFLDFGIVLETHWGDFGHQNRHRGP